jgi:hypothetical protein
MLRSSIAKDVGVLRDRKRWFDKWSGPYVDVLD